MHHAPLHETVKNLSSCSEDLEDISEQLHVSLLSDELDGLMECLPDASVPAKLASSVLPLRAILARRAEGVLLPPTQEKRAKPAMPVGLPPAMAAPRITPSTSPHARRSAAPPPGGPPLPPPRMASIQSEAGEAGIARARAAKLAREQVTLTLSLNPKP